MVVVSLLLSHGGRAEVCHGIGHGVGHAGGAGIVGRLGAVVVIVIVIVANKAVIVIVFDVAVFVVVVLVARPSFITLRGEIDRMFNVIDGAPFFHVDSAMILRRVHRTLLGPVGCVGVGCLTIIFVKCIIILLILYIGIHCRWRGSTAIRFWRYGTRGSSICRGRHAVVARRIRRSSVLAAQSDFIAQCPDVAAADAAFEVIVVLVLHHWHWVLLPILRILRPANGGILW
mmetsp:Transcript_38684/g.81344  ORF Transcript_38684/g.81344 Transcript_38684/m.81344 type:complete len:230 (-) Transcript_38684:10-699(-)